MRRRMLKILAGHMMYYYMVVAAGGGRHHVVRRGRRPPHIMWPASIFRNCLRMNFLLLTHIEISALAHIVFLGQLVSKNH